MLAARRTDRIQMLAEEFGEAVAVTTDMRDPTQVRALVAAATDAYGGVDVLVNNAGQGLHVAVMDIELNDLVAVTELNFYAPLLAMQAVVPSMRRPGGGSIVNVSSENDAHGSDRDRRLCRHEGGPEHAVAHGTSRALA